MRTMVIWRDLGGLALALLLLLLLIHGQLRECMSAKAVAPAAAVAGGQGGGHNLGAELGELLHQRLGHAGSNAPGADARPEARGGWA